MEQIGASPTYFLWSGITSAMPATKASGWGPRAVARRPASLVAYALGITALDPWSTACCSSAFHSTRSASRWPAIATDFCIERRSEVIEGM